MEAVDLISATDVATRFPAVLAWITENRKGNEFAGSLAQRLKTKQNLTPKQLAAVQAKLAPKAPAATEAVSVEAMQPVQNAFDAAMGSGIKRPKLRLSDFILSPAPAHGKNAGAIYVFHAEKTDPQDGGKLYLGKIASGTLTATKACDEPTRTAIAAACVDPLKEAIAYGRRTGNCACCGRELTDAKSVELGIGPICLGKWFPA